MIFSGVHAQDVQQLLFVSSVQRFIIFFISRIYSKHDC